MQKCPRAREAIKALVEDGRFDYLETGSLISIKKNVENICYNTTAPNIGLQLNEDRTTLKCYFCDTGLLISLAFSARGIVAQMLKASGNKLTTRRRRRTGCRWTS